MLKEQNNEISNWFDVSARKAMLKPGQAIQAVISEVTSNHVLVDALLKSEAFVPLYQFANDQEELVVGNELSFSIILLDGGKGDLVLSRDRARLLDALKHLESLMQQDIAVQGTVINQVRGGFTVMLNKIRAFLPNSLTGEAIELNEQASLPIDLKVVRVDYDRHNVIVSRKAVLYANLHENRQKVLEELRVGAIVSGVVKNITSFGAFLDLGGIDALVHISDLSWKRLRHPSEVVKLGDRIEAKVIRYQDDRISLGVKQVAGDPWETAAHELKVNDIVTGVVNHITEYGCFISLENHLEGLIHSSEMSWDNKKVNPFNLVSIGEEVQVKIMDLNIPKRRMAFSMKACMENPWEKFAREHKRKDIVKGKILAITDFGIFMSLAPKIDGLVHISDISWDKNQQVLTSYKVGQEIEAMIVKLEPHNQRVTLSIKHLQADPLMKFITDHPVGSKVKALVTQITDQHAIVELDDFNVGYIPSSKLLPSIKEGDTVSAEIISFNRTERTILLSTVTHRVQKREESAPGFASFGSIILDKLQDLESAEANKDSEQAPEEE
jgi:small subunit ribosomal protein S1